MEDGVVWCVVGLRGWMGSNRAQRTSLCELPALCVCVSEIGKLARSKRKVTLARERDRKSESQSAVVYLDAVV